MDPIIPPNQEPITLNEYIETEFLFYMFPYYYAVVAFIYRHFSLLETDKKYYVNPILFENIFSSLIEHEEPGTNTQLPYKQPTPCFLIKYKVSLWNSFLYLIMIVLSFATSEDLFYGAKHKFHSLLYLFGAISWYLSALVIKKQFQRDISQSLWTHRFFWMLTGVFSVTKMFEDYFLPINLIVNVMFLTIYGLYRPQNNQTVEMIRSHDIPSFVKAFFSTLQLNFYIRSVFGIEDYVRQSFVDDDWYKDQIKQENLDQEEIRQIEATFIAKKQTAQNIKDQINFMNTLPKRNIFVDKKIRYVKENDKYRPYYFILTQVGTLRFEAQRKQKQFLILDAEIQLIFNSKYFPKNTAPKITDIIKKKKNNQSNLQSLEDINDEFGGKAQILQEWLQELVREPLFMIKPVLEFLSIDEERSAAFITYFEFGHKSFCSKAYLISKLSQQKKKEDEIRKSLVGYYEGEDRQMIEESNGSIKNMIKTKFQFKITVNNQITEEKQYGFWIICKSLQKGKMKWMIRKYEQNILQLNQRIEDECKLSIPFYYQILSNVTVISRKAKAQAYRKYLEKLLQSDKYYSISLFQFLRFDPIKVQPKLLTTEMSFSRGDLFELEKQKQKRDSRYFQMWDDMGAFIEVLRIDQMSPQSMDIPIQSQYTEPVGEGEFKFVLRRGGVTLRNKKTKELQSLREKLQNLYRGINYVPTLELKDCSKEEMKNRIQNFLVKIESLPKININKEYRSFYQNSI